MKSKHVLWAIAVCLLMGNAMAQKNEFLKAPNAEVIYSYSSGGSIIFNPNTSLTEKTIFDQGKTNFGLTDGYEMKLVKTIRDEKGGGHFKFQQLFNGVEILNAEYILHTRKEKLHSGNGYIFTPQHILSQRVITESAALESVTKRLSKKDLYWNIEEKQQRLRKKNPGSSFFPQAAWAYVLSSEGASMTLCYRFFIATLENGKTGFYYVSASDGTLLKFRLTSYSCDQTSVTTNYYGTQTIFSNDVAVIGNSYDLEDDCRDSKYTVYNARLQGNPVYNTPDNNWNANTDLRLAASTLYAVKASYLAYKNVFNLSGHRGGNENLDIYNNYDFGSPRFGQNARYTYIPVLGWDDAMDVGYGVSRVAIDDDYNTLDILGHEYTHGVVTYSAGLDYENESGALNESFADIFGEWIEYKSLGSVNWLHGWDMMINSAHSPNRSFINPEQSPGGSQPSKFYGNFWQNVVGCSPSDANDHCFVHTNSGVQNRMFYLLVNGGTGWTNDKTSLANAVSGYNAYPWTISGIGIDQAIAIAYAALTQQLTSTASYGDARNAWVHAATDLFGECSFQAIQTGKAWDAVGIHPSVPTVASDVCGTYGSVPANIASGGTMSVAPNCAVNIQPTGNQVTFLAATKIHLHSGFTGSAGSKFKAYINDDCKYATY